MFPNSGNSYTFGGCRLFFKKNKQPLLGQTPSRGTEQDQQVSSNVDKLFMSIDEDDIDNLPTKLDDVPLRTLESRDSNNKTVARSCDSTR